MNEIEIAVPDIGDFADVEIIEILVSPGDEISVEQSLVTVESDKASMEIPSSVAGKLKELRVKVGDKVAKGSVLGILEAAGEGGGAAPDREAGGEGDAGATSDEEAPTPAASASAAPAAPATPTASAAPSPSAAPGRSAAPAAPPSATPGTPPSAGENGAAAAAPDAAQGAAAGGSTEVRVPDIGDFDEVEVIEVLVAPGDTIALEQSLITVESDKASMEIPSSTAGKLARVLVKVGDKVSKGTPVAVIEAEGGSSQAAPAGAPSAPEPAPPESRPPATSSPKSSPAPSPPAPSAEGKPTAGAGPEPESGRAAARSHPVPAELRAGELAMKPHASPSVRMFARELGVDLAQVEGSGPKQRITADDVRAFVRRVVAKSAAGAPVAAAPAADGGGGLGLIPWPKVDFAKYGEIEVKPQSRIRKIASANLHRNWVMIPHVTNHEDADITDLEAFRLSLNAENAKAGVKLTMLAFLIKVCIAALKKFPEFNASLDGDALVYKKYFHIGFAADTPAGLVVPVIRDADKKGLFDLAAEMSELARKAREGKLGPADMQGGTFSISSLGGIGGTYFTPIINAPEVAILGVCRSVKRPVWNEAKEAFEPRLILPLSLSWDHRVIDGAAAARFNTHLAQLLGDFRRVSL